VKPKNKKISFKKNNENSANVYLTQTSKNIPVVKKIYKCYNTSSCYKTINKRGYTINRL
jgi:ABC-type metal ion transport system substrate-binding protein